MGATFQEVHGFQRVSGSEKREKLVEIWSPDVGRIASAVARRLPNSFQKQDLEQAGYVALLDAIPRVESFLRTRIHGAMLDSAKGPSFREAKHICLANVENIQDGSRNSPLAVLIADEQREAVQSSVRRLPADQARVITANFGDDGRRRGRPRKADVIAEHAALGTLRGVLARAA